MNTREATLEELKEQKRQIEAKIKKLEMQHRAIGCAMVLKNNYATCEQDMWYVAVQCVQALGYAAIGTSRWIKIVEGPDRETVVREIPSVVKDLKALYKAETGEEMKDE